MLQDYLYLIFIFVLFGLFHSYTAQDSFKSKLATWTSPFFVEHFWRIIYCAISLGIWIELFFQPLLAINDGVLLFNYPDWVWNLLPFVFTLGLALAYAAFLQFNYFEFLGLNQAYQGFRKTFGFKTNDLTVTGIDRLEVSGVYKYIRHPMLTGGFLMGLAMPPTKATALYLGLFLVYMLIGAHYEEKRLIRIFGDEYLDYKKQVGAFLPHLKKA